MSYTERALDILKTKGFRLTKPRKLVLDLLDKAERALSAYEIKDLLDAAGEKVDTVSVYRILDCLEETHLIHRIAASGKVLKCSDHDHEMQQEHLVLSCQNCSMTEEVLYPGMSKMIRSIEKTASFKIQNHNIEFFGLCPQCR